MKLGTALVTIFCIVAQDAWAEGSDDELVSCSQSKLKEILEKCNSTLCDVAQIKLEFDGKDFCGYKFVNYAAQPLVSFDPSFHEVEQREKDLMPCTVYNKTDVLLSKNMAIVDGPYLKLVTVPSQAPPAVQDLRAAVTASHHVDVDWQKPDTRCHIRGYNFTYKYTNLTSLQEHSVQSQFLQSHAQQKEEHRLTNVQDDALYKICVAAFVEEKEGESRCATVRTPEKVTAPSPPPHNLSLVHHNSTSLTVTWQPPEGGAQVLKYELSVGEGEDAPVTLHVVPQGAVPYTINHLQPGTRYRVTVKAVSDVGRGEEAVHHYTTEVTAPSPPPHNLSLVHHNSTSLTVTWQPPEGGAQVLEYELSVGEGEDAPVTLHVEPQGAEPYTINHLQPGTRYRVAVRAVSDSGPGEEAVHHYTTEGEDETMRGLMTQQGGAAERAACFGRGKSLSPASMMDFLIAMLVLCICRI